MKSWSLLAATLAFAVGLGVFLHVDRTLAQPAVPVPMGPGGPLVGSGPQMPVGQMMGQMQQQMERMAVTVRAMRARLDRINPSLLTKSEREMFEYLKLLQTQMEGMQGWMGMASWRHW